MIEFKSPVCLLNKNPFVKRCHGSLLSLSVICLSDFFAIFFFEVQNVLTLMKSIHQVSIFIVSALLPLWLFYWPVSHQVVRFSWLLSSLLWVTFSCFFFFWYLLIFYYMLDCMRGVSRRQSLLVHPSEECWYLSWWVAPWTCTSLTSHGVRGY